MFEFLLHFYCSIICSDAPGPTSPVYPGGGGSAGARPRDPPRLLRDGGALHRGGRGHGVEGNSKVSSREENSAFFKKLVIVNYCYKTMNPAIFPCF